MHEIDPWDCCLLTPDVQVRSAVAPVPRLLPSHNRVPLSVVQPCGFYMAEVLGTPSRVCTRMQHPQPCKCLGSRFRDMRPQTGGEAENKNTTTTCQVRTLVMRARIPTKTDDSHYTQQANAPRAAEFVHPLFGVSHNKRYQFVCVCLVF